MPQRTSSQQGGVVIQLTRPFPGPNRKPRRTPAPAPQPDCWHHCCSACRVQTLPLRLLTSSSQGIYWTSKLAWTGVDPAKNQKQHQKWSEETCHVTFFSRPLDGHDVKVWTERPRKLFTSKLTSNRNIWLRSYLDQRRICFFLIKIIHSLHFKRQQIYIWCNERTVFGLWKHF